MTSLGLFFPEVSMTRSMYAIRPSLRRVYIRNEEGLATSTTPNLLNLAGVVQKAQDLGANITEKSRCAVESGQVHRANRARLFNRNHV